MRTNRHAALATLIASVLALVAAISWAGVPPPDGFPAGSFSERGRIAHAIVTQIVTAPENAAESVGVAKLVRQEPAVIKLAPERRQSVLASVTRPAPENKSRVVLDLRPSEMAAWVAETAKAGAPVTAARLRSYPIEQVSQRDLPTRDIAYAAHYAQTHAWYSTQAIVVHDDHVSLRVPDGELDLLPNLGTAPPPHPTQNASGSDSVLARR